ncbi:unnamed protein product [Orchesella dallaii]|uniref:Phosphatidylinositol transfer protein N-terminal domain-containing protein n=1 Tax=Orchesella dallaii TaxID=48710 RepID=A0ABP1PLA2_9HEXA
MPVIREYRVVLPMTVDEYEVARKWHNTEKIKLDALILKEKKANEYPEEVLVKETADVIPYFGGAVERNVGEHSIKRYGWSPDASTSTIFNAFSKFATVCDTFISSSMKITEIETWESFPYYRSVSINQAAKDAYTMIIEAKYLPGKGELENALNLPEDMLQQREIVLLDIAASVPWADYRDGKDPTIYRCSANGRGALKPDEWINTADPVMTCYILVSIKYNTPGVGRMLEKRLHSGIKRAMVLHHRELFCLMDRWIGLTLDMVREMEIEAQEELENASAPGLEEDETKKENASQSGGCPFSMAKDQVCSVGSGFSIYVMPIAMLIFCVLLAVGANKYSHLIPFNLFHGYST